MRGVVCAAAVMGIVAVAVFLINQESIYMNPNGAVYEALEVPSETF